MKKLAILLFSHGLALGAGWLAFRSPDIPSAPGHQAAARITKKPRSDDDAEARRVLAEMRQGWGTEIRPTPDAVTRESIPTTIARAKLEQRRQQAEELEEIRKRSLAVVLPADPAAALTKLAAGPEIRDTAAFAIAWLRADPAAALGFLQASIVSQDLSRWMGAEQLGEAVKSGGMGAAGVWQEATARFPQFADQEREGMLRAVFSGVAAYDPEGAMKLLEDQGLGDQAGRYVSWALDRLGYTARHYFKNGNEALGTELKNLVRDPTVKSWPNL